MPYNGTYSFLNKLKENNLIEIIDDFISPNLEISEITDRYSKNNGKALLFNNTGTKFPVLTNSMGSEERICIALNVNNLNDFGEEIKALFQTLTQPQNSIIKKIKLLPKLKNIGSWMPKSIKGKGQCQDVIIDPPDINALPVLKTWPHDGGKFITLPIVHTKDPETGQRNVGMYRMQVFSSKICAMHWHRHKGGARHFDKYKEKGEKMPVAVILGGDPAYTYAATAPMPDNFDEYLLAGFIRKKNVKLVKCITQDIEVPADADFVIEGYIDPKEDFLWEGPFGDHTGFYSLPDWYPAFHITAITHRKNAIYPATIVGIPPQEDKWLGKATERIFLAPLQLTIAPEIKDINMPVEGVFHNIVIVKIKKEYPGHALKVMNSLWGAGQMMFSKILVIVDDDVDIENYEELAKRIELYTNPLNDVHINSGPMDVLDHAGNKPSFGGKLGIDATKKSDDEGGIDKDYKTCQFDYDSFETEIKKNIPEIKKINSSLCEKGINIIFAGIEKNKSKIVKSAHNKITSMECAENTKAIIYTDIEADFDEINMLIWRCANNYDPKRDTFFPEKEISSAIGLDCTRKTKKYDDFNRPWPNIVTMDETIINAIDDKWKSLGLKQFYNSPSKKYLSQSYKGKAQAEE